jgi:hypothetical protein
VGARSAAASVQVVTMQGVPATMASSILAG